jgi:threonine dehydrogenase-like Zn-dependent dehydrogenase
VPDSIDDLSAVLIEPLAAACHILDQVKIDSSMRVAVIGDGKLAQMIVIALAATQCQLTVIGRHREKLDLAQKSGAQRAVVAGQEAVAEKSFDVVVEASGSPSGLADALRLARPLGAVVLKSTHHQTAELAMSQMVVDEVSITGSRCGRFLPAIEMLNNCALDLRPLISHHYSIDDGLSAFEKSAERTSLKVLLHID